MDWNQVSDSNSGCVHVCACVCMRVHATYVVRGVGIAYSGKCTGNIWSSPSIWSSSYSYRFYSC